MHANTARKVYHTAILKCEDVMEEEISVDRSRVKSKGRSSGAAAAGILSRADWGLDETFLLELQALEGDHGTSPDCTVPVRRNG